MCFADQLAFTLRFKEAVVSRTKSDESTDIAPIVIFERGSDLLAICQACQVDRDLGLTLLARGRHGFGATATCFVTDCHYSNALKSPATGEAWQPGEMQELCDHAGACDAGYLTDCLTVIRYDGERFDVAVEPYHVDRVNRVVHWLADRSETIGQQPGDTVEGLVPETIRAIFSEPDLFTRCSQAGQLPQGLGVEELRPIMDDTTVTALRHTGCELVRGPDARHFMDDVLAGRLNGMPATS